MSDKHPTNLLTEEARDNARRQSGQADEPLLKIHIRAFEIKVDRNDRNLIRRKLDRRFRKFAESIERVSVRLEDVNGPRGGVDRACRIKTVLRNLPSVVYEQHDASLQAAFDGALEGAERAVRRTLQRRRSQPIKRGRQVTPIPADEANEED